MMTGECTDVIALYLRPRPGFVADDERPRFLNAEEYVIRVHSKSSRLVRVDISFQAIENIFRTFPETTWTQCCKGLPEGATLVGGQLVFNGLEQILDRTLVLYFEHESFAEVPEFEDAPLFPLQFMRMSEALR